MFSSVFRGSQGAITKTLTSRSSIYRPQIPSRTLTSNLSTAFQPPFKRAFSSATSNASREQLSNKDALEATKNAYEADLLALETERQRRLDAAKEHLQKDIEAHRKDLGYTAAGRDITADVLDFIRRKPWVAVDLRESAPTCRDILDSVLHHYGIRHARSPPAKKGKEKKPVTEAEVATVPPKESVA
ncbi:hypothetical protein K4K49_005025 [Colletotrichum sp. SAR 10_70]|nr:hypothetical protein K4K50_011151 [Colletotrichum sp. SAR 10_71]KAI8168752.1 hypothetical protein K4K49_005025 [Colletotrichum sp. SAR 10_70]